MQVYRGQPRGRAGTGTRLPVRRGFWSRALVLLLSLLLPACADMVGPAHAPAQPESVALSPDPAGPVPPPGVAVVAFTLKTMAHEGGLAFVGVGGPIDGSLNPVLHANRGDRVAITLVNAEPSEHDFAVPDLHVQSARVRGLGTQTRVEFTAAQEGQFAYYCTLAGHRQAGMTGRLVVGNAGAGLLTPAPAAPTVSRAPTDLPPPVGHRAPQVVRVSLEAMEIEGRLADGTTYPYWTFNGTVPGPFVRVRVGDTVEVRLKNSPTSHMTHSIDLHAVSGPGGGAALMQVPPGQEKQFTFQATHAGIFVYHCASPLIAEHLAAGMYGLILVEPPGGLPAVDHEFYVMQGEIYTRQPFGTGGRLEPSTENLLAAQPEYYVFNGAVDALMTQPLRARVGETVRIYFGVGGPNYPSSFHIVGAVFDRVYREGSLTSPPVTDVQTTLVPPGGATVVEWRTAQPGTYMLMDHALARAALGLGGALIVDGPPQPALFHAGPADAGTGP